MTRAHPHNSRSDGGYAAALGGEVAVASAGVAEPVKELVAQHVGLDDLVDDEVGGEVQL